MNPEAPDVPEWIGRFLNAICPDRLLEEIEGDLLQKFHRDVRKFGTAKARRRYIWNGIRFFRPGIVFRNSFSFQLINTIMLRNYLIIAYRNVLKNKTFSAINITGLGLGLAACLLIFQFVSTHLSYDKFNAKYDRIYRVTNDRFQHGKLIQHGTITYPTIGPTMAKDFPEIEMYSRLMPAGQFDAKVDDKSFAGDYVHMVDEHFLSLFTFPMIIGDPVNALKERFKIVLTESTARKYFEIKGNDFSSVMGKNVFWGTDQTPYVVTGVCSDVPENSHIQFDVLVSYASLIWPESRDADDSWTWSDFRHYIVLKPGADPKALEAKFPEYSDRYFKGDKVSGSVEKFYLQPLNKAHMYSDYEYDIARTVSGKAVWAMLIVAVFILVIAWINYINLTTSRALDRAKEVGLRKVMGAMKSQLVNQFIFESVLISFLALVLALLVMQFSQAGFNEIVRDKLSLWKVLGQVDSSTVMLMTGVMIAGILLSGFYPAFVLSSYQPVSVLKGKFQRSTKGSFLRKGLVIFQFAASAALISGTLIVSKQLQYMNKADLGIDIQDIMIIRPAQFANWDSTYINRIESFKHELLQLNGVKSVATSSRLPGDRLGRAFGVHLADQESSLNYTMSFLGADYNFLETYKVDLIAGRHFQFSDHNANFDDIKVTIINQRAVQLLGIPTASDAVGREIVQGRWKWKIVGVVSDFHQESLKKPMEAILFTPTYSTNAPTSLRIDRSKTAEIIASAETVFKKFFADNKYDYNFLQDSYREQYNDDERFRTVISIFTVLAIVISCLGLIGLSSYTTVQRTKEIGIRKALGASVAGIITLLSTDFMRLIAVSIILAIPVAYFAMENWLTNYPYRIELDWFLFAVPSLLILMIALVTIIFQIWKTARTNPVETLRYE